MRVKNLTGFMLGNMHHVHSVGSAWSNCDDGRVWICATLDKARRILERSQAADLKLEPHVLWETVYQVSARDIVCEKTNDGLWYTNTPSKIFVERIVMQRDAMQITDADLIKNARKHYGKFAQLMLGLTQENVK